ncbi:heat shock 70 kDa protein 12A-like [Glandiceps talaboti]
MECNPDGRESCTRDSSDHLATVAIDFGNAYTRYAFAVNNSAGEVRINLSKEWRDSTGNNTSMIPTCILLNPNESFNSFGYEAQDVYVSLEEEKDKSHLFFDGFKMELDCQRNKTINNQMKVSARNGTAVAAIKVFGHALNYIKEKAIGRIRQSAALPVTTEDIKWVLTVPAIWQQRSKHFMREAAHWAGLVSPHKNNLVIALEPEAASIYCKDLKLGICAEGFDKTEIAAKKPGGSYMVVDCGGGTVDITVHNSVSGTYLEEICKPSGGAWGGTQVDEEFAKLLSKIFGVSFIEKFKKKSPAGWLAICREFQSTKCSDKAFEGEPTRVSLSNYEFLSFYREKFNKELTEMKFLDESIQFARGFLKVNAETMESLFKPTIESITEHLLSLFKNRKVANIDMIYLIGGFAKSKLLQRAMEKEFGGDYKICTPFDASLATVKGAVKFGMDMGVIRKRVSAFTYGIEIWPPFDPVIHDIRYKVSGSNSEDKCKCVFSKLVEVNEQIDYGESKEFIFCPVFTGQDQIRFDFYCTEQSNAYYVDEPHVRKEGTSLVIKSPSVGKGTERKIKLKIIFGDTEIRAIAIDMESNETAVVQVDFML